jgi:hypothetical protein
MNSDRRLLIAIGCDNYDHLPPLGGAVLDAKNVFEALTSPDYGNYPLDSAILLALLRQGPEG